MNQTVSKQKLCQIKNKMYKTNYDSDQESLYMLTSSSSSSEIGVNTQVSGI